VTLPVGRWVEAAAARAPEAAALRFAEGSVSYGELARRVAGCAAALRERFAIGPGDRVAALMHNRPEFVALCLACARLGVICQPLNWRLAAPELAWQLGDSGAALLVVDEANAPLAAGLPTPTVACGELDAAGDATADPPADAPCLLVYTSGTTGRPKGAMLSHRALATVAANGIDGFGITEADRVLSVLPMFHVGGLNILTLPALKAGATVILHERFEPGMALAAIARERPTLTLVVPAVMQAMIAHPDWATTDLSSLRAVGAGSSVIPRALIDAFHARGVPVMQVYGATETGPTATVLPRADAIRKAGSCGLPASHSEIEIFRDDGARAGDDERGELWVRGGNLFSGYWRDEASTRAAFAPGGWFRSGDIGHRDGEGFLWVDDRKSDLIISGGENVYPAELEAVLAAHPAVARCAVVARRDPRWGEVPVAFVALRQGATLSRADALALFDGRLARFKHPRDIVFVDQLPTTALGKVEKFRLRAMLEGG